MESLNQKCSVFDLPPETVVVTTKYVTKEGAPILEVTHEYDEEEGHIWQFHCGNGDYGDSVLQLVRLDEILEIDPSLHVVADLPAGCLASRTKRRPTWKITKIK